MAASKKWGRESFHIKRLAEVSHKLAARIDSSKFRISSMELEQLSGSSGLQHQDHYSSFIQQITFSNSEIVAATDEEQTHIQAADSHHSGRAHDFQSEPLSSIITSPSFISTNMKSVSHRLVNAISRPSNRCILIKDSALFQSPVSAARYRLFQNKRSFFLGIPFVTAGQLPSGAALQHVTFGSLTTIDDELTEGEELGSAVMGRGQGFYFVSSLDGSSHTVALTIILDQHDEDVEKKDEDTISFFGVHRRGSPESPVAVVGGTGKYENAGGFAVIENLRRRENQYMTDGDDTIVHFRVYLSE